MARLNTRPSTTVASSRYGSPSRSDVSNQENYEPDARHQAKRKAHTVDNRPRMSLPTPTSDASQHTARGQKRKRQYLTQPDDIDEDSMDEDEAKFNRYFDPNQDADERRRIKRASRMLERDFNDNRDTLMQGDGSELRQTVERADRLFKDVKQTNDAQLDSRLLVNVSDLASKKTKQLVLGDYSAGIDVELLLSKCITFLTHGGPVNGDQAPTRSQRRRRGDDSDAEDDDDSGGVFDWEVFGRHACFPYNSRPPVPSFLLGPLSVEKKQRTQMQRRARQSKDTNAREIRPEALTRAELSQSDENGLTAICGRIGKHLAQHCEVAERAAARIGITDVSHPRAKAFFKKYRVTATGGPSLFDYVVNPRSFGQTVENLFYISFLIKEGRVGVEHDTEGLPTILPTKPRTVDEQREQKTKKHQAVLALDYATWRSLIEAFEITEPMIPHRDDEPAAAIGQRGWYT